MKKNLGLVIALFIGVLVNTAFAQTSIVVESGDRPFSRGTANAYSTLVPEGKLKDVRSTYESFIKSQAKAKTEELSGELVSSECKNTNIHDVPFTIITRLLETKEGVQITTFFLLYDTIYISKVQNNDKDQAAIKFMRDLGVEAYTDVVKKQLDAEQKKLKDLEKQLDDLRKDEEKAQRKIGEKEREIERTNGNIEQNKRDQDAKLTEIANHKSSTAALTGDMKKAADKKLKDLQGEKKGLEKTNEKMFKDIDKMKSEISAEQVNVAKYKKEQELKAAEVENQRAVVNNIDLKLKGIK